MVQALLPLCLLAVDEAKGHDCPALEGNEKAALLQEHLFGGAPSSGTILIRRGYAMEYDAARRVPRWIAWHAVPEYLDTPEREDHWRDFHTDPDIANPVVHGDYTGLQAEFDLVRGHMVPYFIAGGDRDGDGMDAEIELVDDQPIEDIDDACTVFEINYMSNVTPQFHADFNGAGGLWFALETKVRNDILGDGRSLHIIAGTVFGDVAVQMVGPDSDIHVPHMFYKILIADEGIAAFLFVHQARIGSKGCALTDPLESCIVSVGDIEAVTELDFLAGLDDESEALLEGTDGHAVWAVLLEQ
jgi:endonuclease G